MADGQAELADHTPGTRTGEAFCGPPVGPRSAEELYELGMASARKRDQAGRAALLEAAQPLANRGPSGGDRLQTMVVSVFHLTHQIEITSCRSHNAAILPAARWLALPWPAS